MLKEGFEEKKRVEITNNYERMGWKEKLGVWTGWLVFINIGKMVGMVIAYILKA